MISCVKRAANCCVSTFGFLSSTRTYDEKSLKQVERILVYKARVAMAMKFGLYLLSFFSPKSYFDRAMLLRVNNSADVDLEV